MVILHSHGLSIQNDSIPSEVNIIQDPPTQPSATESLSNNPDGSVASLNLAKNSTTKKIDSIIEEIDEPNTTNNEHNERDDCMLLMTSNGILDYVYHLDLDHILQLNDIPTTYNLWVQKKNRQMSKSNIQYQLYCEFCR